jgi:hypothetical protein
MGQGLLVAPEGVGDSDLLEPFTWTSGSCRSEGTTKQRAVEQTENENEDPWASGTVAVDGSRSLSSAASSIAIRFILSENLFVVAKPLNDGS